MAAKSLEHKLSDDPAQKDVSVYVAATALMAGIITGYLTQNSPMETAALTTPLLIPPVTISLYFPGQTTPATTNDFAKRVSLAGAAYFTGYALGYAMTKI